MALTTRCPNCGTAFKVVSDQLRVRNGLVRCGACNTIFDGRACLLDEQAAPAVPVPPPHKAPPLPSVLRKRSDMIVLSPRETADEYAADGSERWDPVAHYAERPVLGEARLRFSSAVDAGRAPPDFLNEDHRRYERRVWAAWGWACIVGLLALCLQLLFVYRSAIATAMPALRPVMEAACAPLNCRVGYARRIERIAIVSSSLQPLPGAIAPENGGRTRLTLSVSLRNRYNRDQTWPALVLALTDLSDTVVIRKVLLPEEYLSSEQAHHPLAAGAEVTVSVPIVVTGVQVNGYQLDKFFP